MPKAAPPLEIPPRDKRRLRAWTQSRNIPAGLAQRARIVLLAGHGLANAEIAERTGVSRPTVILWRNRYAEGGLGALEDQPRSGRPKRIDPLEIVIRTLEPPPARLGVTHWSSRLLAAEMGISNATVATVWQDYDLQPWRSQTFKFSTDPQLEAKVRDIAGLYLNPPENAVVVCVDEKTQIQALNPALGAAPFVEEALRWLPDATDREPQEQVLPGHELLPVPCPPMANGKSTSERPYVLVADDNSDMRQYLIRLLGERYEV